MVWHDKWAIGTRDIRAARVSEQGQVLSEFLVYEHSTKDSAQPTVDYDPVNDRYLVAWIFDFSGDGSDWDLYGRFIPWAGPSVSLTEFPICTWTTHQWNPRVAYGRAVEEFLVIWNNQYQSGPLPMYISGRRVKGSDGTFPGGSGSDLTISHGTENRIDVERDDGCPSLGDRSSAKEPSNQQRRKQTRTGCPNGKNWHFHIRPASLLPTNMLLLYGCRR